MTKKLLQDFKQKLEQEKVNLEKGLSSFATKDSRLEGDWDTKMPAFETRSEEEEGDKIEEYVSRLPVEHSLEIRLQEVNSALEKIKKGKYGKCEKCGKNIAGERLEIYPAAKLCGKCK